MSSRPCGLPILRHAREGIRNRLLRDTVRRWFYLWEVLRDVLVFEFQGQFGEKFSRDLRVCLKAVREGQFTSSAHRSRSGQDGRSRSLREGGAREGNGGGIYQIGDPTCLCFVGFMKKSCNVPFS